MLNPNDYAMLFSEAAAADDLDAFVSDWALSSLWGDPPDREDIPEERITFLRKLWEVSGWSISEICYAARITMTELSQLTLKKYRTLQNWSGGQSQFRTDDRYLLLHFLDLLPRL